jgi:hypothetical protein
MMQTLRLPAGADLVAVGEQATANGAQDRRIFVDHQDVQGSGACICVH